MLTLVLMGYVTIPVLSEGFDEAFAKEQTERITRVWELSHSDILLTFCAYINPADKDEYASIDLVKEEEEEDEDSMEFLIGV